MLIADPHAPFAHDADYLQLEYRWLRARSKRLAAGLLVDELCEAQFAPDHSRLSKISYRDAHLSHVDHAADEERLRRQIDARLEVHRAERPKHPLGLDRIAREHGLDAAGRMLVLAAALPGVSQRYAEEVLGDFVTFHGALSVDDLCRLLDPQSLREHLKARALFHEDAPLRRRGLLLIEEPSGELGPETLHSLEVRVSLATWGVLFGFPQVVDEAGGALAAGLF